MDEMTKIQPQTEHGIGRSRIPLLPSLAAGDGRFWGAPAAIAEAQSIWRKEGYGSLDRGVRRKFLGLLVSKFPFQDGVNWGGAIWQHFFSPTDYIGKEYVFSSSGFPSPAVFSEKEAPWPSWPTPWNISSRQREGFHVHKNGWNSGKAAVCNWRHFCWGSPSLQMGMGQNRIGVPKPPSWEWPVIECNIFHVKNLCWCWVQSYLDSWMVTIFPKSA